MKWISLLLLMPFVAVGQVNVSGKVILCDDFQKGLTIKGVLSYTHHREKKKRPYKSEIDTLQATISVYRMDSLILREYTSHKGQFKLTLPEKATYRLKFSLTGMIYRDTVMDIQMDQSNIQICLSDSAIHNYYLRKIPFDSTRAKKDIQNDTIRIINLFATDISGCRLSLLEYLSMEEKETIENKFGFRFSYFGFSKISPFYLDKRQKEYNDVVYSYLDKKLKGDSRRLILDEVYQIIKKK